MFAARLKCKVIETRWATPSVFLIRFKPSRLFSFLPGQFISVVIPTPSGPVKRCYSLASSPEESRSGAYELCVKLVAGGVGSTFLAKLRPGAEFEALAPFGNFTYRPVEPGRGVVFVCTGSGIAPFRAIAASRLYQESRPTHGIVLYGARDEKEILYERDLRQLGLEMTAAVSNPSPTWEGFKGRVTDYLRSMGPDFPWHKTDFYLCGNGPMVQDVVAILQGGRGVATSAIHRENFSPVRPGVRPEPVSRPEEKPSAIVLPFPQKCAA